MKYIKLYEELKKYNSNMCKCIEHIKNILESLNFNVVCGINDIIVSDKINYNINFMLIINYFKGRDNDDLYLKIIRGGDTYYTFFDGTEKDFEIYINTEFTEYMIKYIHHQIDDEYLVNDYNLDFILTNHPEYINYFDKHILNEIGYDIKDKYDYLFKNDLF